MNPYHQMQPPYQGFNPYYQGGPPPQYLGYDGKYGQLYDEDEDED
jgi:hypothetical protein